MKHAFALFLLISASTTATISSVWRKQSDGSWKVVADGGSPDTRSVMPLTSNSFAPFASFAVQGFRSNKSKS
jgi:hypothetical protein